MAVATPKRQCTATSKQSGKRCQQPPIPGGTVCRFHGGNAPQVRAKAEERLKAVDPAITVLAEILADPDHPQRLAAAREVLERDGRIGQRKVEQPDNLPQVTAEEFELIYARIRAKREQTSTQTIDLPLQLSEGVKREAASAHCAPVDHPRA